MSIRNAYRKFKQKGYIGPKYYGLAGKVKLFLQGHLGHYEIVVYAEPSFWHRCNYEVDPKFTLEKIENYAGCIQYLKYIEDAYYEGFTAAWKSNFSWGETLWLTFLDEKPAYFMWAKGGSDDAKCFYTPLKDGEFRFLRGGTLPHMRNKRALINGHILSLDYLFKNGARKVFTEAFEDNIYSTRGHMAAGYKIFGRIFVGRSLSGKNYIRWV